MSHNFLIRNSLRGAITTRASRYLKGRLIDVGCGTKQYEGCLGEGITEHLGLDRMESPHGLQKVDLIGTAYDIPVEDNSFDSILCTEVLEHLEEPSRALTECRRALKPGGYALFTSPFIWHLHEEPRDFFRYSKHGLQYLFTTNDFQVVEITPLNGFWATFGQLFVYNLHSYNRWPIRLTPLIPVMGLLIQHVAMLLDRMSTRDIWTSHYVSVVRKSDG